MKTYKDIERLEKRAIKNNGKRVEIWNDEGINVGGKAYKMVEYGNMGYNFTGNEYVRFENNKLGGIEIEYQLTSANNDRHKDIFNLVEVKDLRYI